MPLAKPVSKSDPATANLATRRYCCQRLLSGGTSVPAAVLRRHVRCGLRPAQRSTANTQARQVGHFYFGVYPAKWVRFCSALTQTNLGREWTYSSTPWFECFPGFSVLPAADLYHVPYLQILDTHHRVVFADCVHGVVAWLNLVLN